MPDDGYRKSHGACKAKKALLYLEKNDSMYGMGKSYLFSTYADYLRDCEELEMDFTEKATLFPKDLEQLHVKLQNKSNARETKKPNANG